MTIPPQPRAHKRLIYLNAIAAVTTVAVEYVVYLALVYAFAVGIEAANVMGAIVGIVVNFTMSRRMVFPDATGHWGKQAVRYCLATAVGIAICTALLHVLVNSVGIPHWIAWGLANLTQFTVWTYPTNHFLVFPQRPRVKSAGQAGTHPEPARASPQSDEGRRDA